MHNRNGFLICMLLLTSLLVSALGFAGKDSVYAAYDYDWKNQTLLSLPLKGMQDGESLFASLQKPTTAPDVADADVTEPEPEADSGNTDTADADADASADSAEDPPAEKKEQPENTPAVTIEDPVSEDTGNAVPEEEPDATDNVPQEIMPETEDDMPAAEPVPETVPGAPADDSYYADALFIGDSRTVGLSQYVPGLDSYATFYCAVSLSVFNALSAPIATVDGVSMSVDDALQQKTFGKIYLMVGINEIGYERNAWLETYRSVIARIRELQPAATIYIQSIMHVSSGKEAANPVFNNAEVNARNEGLKTFANGTDIFYIDINYLIDDANGALSADLTFDGVHLTAGAYDLWYQEIRAQTR